MYKTKENAEIGKYLSDLINEKFVSVRKFCEEYLKAEGEDNPDSGMIQRMTNRMSQIMNGKKGIQLRDFPIFAKLLGVSCEEILSAGEYAVPTRNHVTNYDVASSRDEKFWEEYVHREDKLILNLDEYGKTVLEYALEFKNFEFLKYLIEKRYVWFVDGLTDPEDYSEKCTGLNFGVGTSIGRRLLADRDTARWHISCSAEDRGHEHRTPLERDTLKYELAGNDNLRMRMVSLAVEHDETELLKQLRAREIPSLYQASVLLNRPADCDSFYDEKMVERIAGASERVLEYFSEEFEIKDRHGETNWFLFPYTSKLLNLLMQNGSVHADKMLRTSLNHNRKVLAELKGLKEKSIDEFVDHYSQFCRDKKVVKAWAEACGKEVTDQMMDVLSFYDNGSMVVYRDITENLRIGMVTNVIQADEKLACGKMVSLVRELNGIHEEIREKTFLKDSGTIFARRLAERIENG